MRPHRPEGRNILAHSHAYAERSAGWGNVIGGFAFLTHLAIIPVYLFFFLITRGDPTKQLKPNLTFLSPSVRTDVVFLTREFIGIVETFLSQASC